MNDDAGIFVNGKPMGYGLDGMLRALHEMVPGYGVSVDDEDTGPYDPDELVHWAEQYGHPESWAKKAQQLHADNERLQLALLAAAPLADVPGTPKVVAEKLRGIVTKALREQNRPGDQRA